MKKIRRLQVGGIPVISSIIEKLELKRILSKHLKLHANAKISEVESLMIVRCSVVTGRRPLYELNNWLSNIHPQCFGFEEFEMSIFNDDRFGRAIEKVSKADRATIITEVILVMINKFGIKTDQLHNLNWRKAIGKRNLNIKTQRDITGEMGVGVLKAKVYLHILKKVG